MSARRRAFVGFEAFGAAAAVFAATCLVERPFAHGFSFGLTYQAMSEAPFAWQGLFPHRVLLPLLAHALGLAGDRFWIVSHATAVLLLWLVHLAARRWGARPLDALLATAAVGFSGAVQLYKSHVGYPDSLSFLLLLGAVMAVRSTAACWSLVLLGALAHEQVFFFVPVLLALRRRVAAAPVRADALAVAAVGAAYAAFRVYVAAHAAPQAIEPGYYFGNGYFPLGFLGVLYLALVQVALVFGPFVPLFGWLAAAPRARWERTALLLYTAGIVGIYLVAHDFNRFVNFLFLPLLVASVRFLQGPKTRLVLLGMVALQALATRFVVMPVTERLAAPMFECRCLTGVPAELTKLVTYVLPRVWPWVAGAVLLLALLFAVGVSAARRGLGISARSAV